MHKTPWTPVETDSIRQMKLVLNWGIKWVPL